MRRKVVTVEEETEAYKLFLLLNQTADGLRKLRQRNLDECGITMEQAAALICINILGEEATSSALSKWLFREINTVTALVNGLEKRGYLVRIPLETNKKIKRLQLTDSGREALEHASCTDFLYDSLLRLSPQKRKQLDGILEDLREKTFTALGLDVNEYILYRNAPDGFLRKAETGLTEATE